MTWWRFDVILVGDMFWSHIHGNLFWCRSWWHVLMSNSSHILTQYFIVPCFVIDHTFFCHFYVFNVIIVTGGHFWRQAAVENVILLKNHSGALLVMQIDTALLPYLVTWYLNTEKLESWYHETCGHFRKSQWFSCSQRLLRSRPWNG